MASTWKYAALPASERIEMLKNGNKEVLNEEVERTKEVVNARQELGLDTKQQEDWLDTVAYSYNLSNAEKMGISKENVAKTGYAALYLDGGSKSGTSSSGRTTVTEYKTTTGLTSTPISNAKRKIERAGELAKEAIEQRYAEKKAQIENEFYEANPHVREYILNRGGHDDGGNMAKINLELATKLDELLSMADAERDKKLAESKTKYANLVEELLDYRRNGAEKSSLGIIADGIIFNAAREDGFDYTQIPGVSFKKPIKAVKNDDEKFFDYSDFIDTDTDDKSEMADAKKKMLLMSENEETKNSDEAADNVEASESADSEKKLAVGDMEVFKRISDSISEIAGNLKDGAVEKALEIVMKHGNIGKSKASLILKLIADSFAM